MSHEADEAALREAVLKDPLSDLPRLIFADWLDERGSPRGEFIRVQCALAEGTASTAELKRLRCRERELLYTNWAWEAEAPLKLRKPRFVRGFVGSGILSVQHFNVLGEQLVAEAPLESLTLTAGANRMAKLAQCPWLAQLRELSLDKNDFEPGSFPDFAQSPYLGTLESLTVRRSRLQMSDAEALAQASTLKQLKRLKLDRTRTELADLAVLAASPNFKQLQSLSFHPPRADGEFLRGAAFNNTLRELEVFAEFPFGHSLGNSIMRTLADSPSLLPSLERLMLNYGGVENHVFVEFVLSNSRPGLHTLGLNGSLIDDEAAYVLASSELMSQLRLLRLNGSAMTIEGIRALARSPRRRKGARFELHSQRFSNRQLEAMRQEFGTFGCFVVQ